MNDISPAIEMIPIEQIKVINPRVRNRKIFGEVVESIADLGLKRPVTVSRREYENGTTYDLVCGQGRLEAYKALGQQEIPALVIEGDTEDCLVMSLVENLARRQHRAIDLLEDINLLKERGYSDAEISRKTGLSLPYVNGVTRLFEKGELRLLRGVESGHIPLSVAVQIAGAGDEESQGILQQAYESKQLRGKKLLAARRLLETRRRRGIGLGTRGIRNSTRIESSENLVRTYQEDVEKKKLMIRKAEATRGQLIFIVEALRTLLEEESFVDLLRLEGLDTLPRHISERLSGVEPT